MGYFFVSQITAAGSWLARASATVHLTGDHFHSGRFAARWSGLWPALLLGACLLPAYSPPADAADWYVNSEVSTSGDGSSWPEAFKTIQEAIDRAFLLGGYEIWVAKGTYTLGSSIHIPWDPLIGKAPLKLYGGFQSGAVTLAERNWVDNLTVIDGNSAVESVITIDSWVDLIDGFLITGGTAGSLGTGGAIDIRGCGSASPQPVLQNLVIRGNGGDTSHAPSYYEGGGIYIQDCSPWIVNVSFSGNRVWGHGGALFARDADDTPVDTYPMIVNSTFTGNHSDVNGGAVGVYRGTLTIVNSILWGDSAGDGVTHEVFGATLAVSFSDVGQVGYAGVNGNINQDPKMTGIGRYHLRDDSPCIDTGDSTQVPPFLTTDFDGDDRFIDGITGTTGGMVDMGADEYLPGAFSGVYYVDGDNGDDLFSGTSWGTAFKTIQGAVAVAVSDAEIWVKQGTYTLTSSVVLSPVNSSLAFYGGFAGTETLLSQRNTDASLTVIDGQNAHACFSLQGTLASHIQDVIIDGFTLTRGNRALTISYADGTLLNNCRLTGAIADGAIGVSWSDLVVSNSLFSGNRASNRAGAIHMGVGTDRLTVSRSTFINNSAEDLVFTTSGCGGAIVAGSGSIDHSRFLGNKADRHGGAVYNYADIGDGLVIRNSEFSGNLAGLDYFLGTGGATWGPLEIVNSSISRNGATVGAGGSSSPSKITNSILWENDLVAGTLNTNLHCANGKVFYSNVGDVSYSDVNACQIPYGNINAAPQFKDADGADNTAGTTDDDLDLLAGSPVIDAGDSTALEFGSLDLAGNTRFVDDPNTTDSGYGPTPIIDMGAFELQRDPGDPPPSQFALNISVAGSGTTDPVPGNYNYLACELVPLQAAADPGWDFRGWDGWVHDPDAPDTFVQMCGDRDCIANFVQVQTLDVDFQGTGAGNVTSTPAGITCSSDCASLFDHDETITLSAVAEPGTAFDGWVGGGCLDTGDCQITLDENLSIAALFNLEGACGLGDQMPLADLTIDWDQTFESCSEIEVVDNLRIESPATVIFRTAGSVSLGSGFAVAAGASFSVDIYGDVGLAPGLSVSKTADPSHATPGEPVNYTISVANTGAVPLTPLSVSDDKCSAAPAFVSGDDGNGKLDVAETWIYTCGSFAGSMPFTNTATATFIDALGEQVSGSGSALVTVTVAACAGVRYLDMGDGTIFDCNTNLFWLRIASCSDLPGTDGSGMANWDNAISASASLAPPICGLSDGSTAGQWRLPTMDEWCGGWDGSSSGTGLCDPALGLINGNYTSPAVGNTTGDGQWTEGNPFSGVWAFSYWSSTENTGDQSQSWAVDTYNGLVFPALKSYESVLVWPVRDPL